MTYCRTGIALLQGPGIRTKKDLYRSMPRAYWLNHKFSHSYALGLGIKAFEWQLIAGQMLRMVINLVKGPPDKLVSNLCRRVLWALSPDRRFDGIAYRKIFRLWIKYDRTCPKGTSKRDGSMMGTVSPT
jgi:hypothetical protein